MPSKLSLTSGRDITVEEAPSEVEEMVRRTRLEASAGDSPFCDLTERYAVEAMGARRENTRPINVRYSAVELIRAA